MDSFGRCYKIAAIILCGGAVLAVLAVPTIDLLSMLYAVVALAMSAVALVPIFQGGVGANTKLAIGISAVYSLIFAALLGIVFYEFVKSGGGEGPRGEGSPLVVILAMTFFAVFFLCPWLLAFLRGVRFWNRGQE